LFAASSSIVRFDVAGLSGWGSIRLSNLRCQAFAAEAVSVGQIRSHELSLSFSFYFLLG
jgi:hypothetical protein